jgi:hypothetical protein
MRLDAAAAATGRPPRARVREMSVEFFFIG